MLRRRRVFTECFFDDRERGAVDEKQNRPSSRGGKHNKGGGGCGEMSVFIRCFDRMHVRGRQYVNCTSNLSLLCTENKLVEFIFPLVPVQMEILYTFCYLEA